MSKGKRRERQAAEIWEEAGFSTYRPQESKWGETDIFNLFDMLAISSNSVHLVQVKSNRAEGYYEWADGVSELPACPRVMAYMAVCHDSQGWRLMGHCMGEKYVWVDERDDPSTDMGEGLVSWLQDTTG